MKTREYFGPDRARRIAARLGGEAISGTVFAPDATEAAADAAELAEGICPKCGWVLNHQHLPGACTGCCVHPNADDGEQR